MRRLLLLFVAFAMVACAKENDPKPEPEYSIVVSSGGNGVASASKTKSKAGETITLTAVADDGYDFDKWVVVSGGVTIANNSFTMPAADVSLKAEFVEDLNLWPEPVDIPFEEYSLDGTEAEWVNQRDPMELGGPMIFIINSDDELDAHIDNDYPPIDFETKTLVLADGALNDRIISFDKKLRKRADSDYRLVVDFIVTANTSGEDSTWRIAMIVDKLPSESEIIMSTTVTEMETRAISPILTDYYYLAGEKVLIQTLERQHFMMDDGQTGISSKRFSVRIADGFDLRLLENLAEEHSLEFLGANENLDGWYELACTEHSSGDGLQMGNLFYETGLFEGVSYDLPGRGALDCINESLFSDGSLWHLGNNRTNPQIHVNYCNSRSLLSSASSDITVAIIDSGVKLNHGDIYNLLPGWDVESGKSPNVMYDRHGTNVAGFIGAIPNNREGVAGISYGVRILPISFAANALGIIQSDADEMARAIGYAVDNGADVINCSWSYPDDKVGYAINEALGAGCVVVFSSGNNTNTVRYPANSDPRIIVVGSIDKNGIKADSSAYGSELDVVAPGVDVVTTYTLGGTYATAIVSGTSFAAPQVAAAAALVLSINPNFTIGEVSDIIEKSARKLPAYSATQNKVNGLWNNYVGYGLLDVYETIRTAQIAASGISISGPERATPQTTVQYTIPATLRSGVTFAGWTITPGPVGTTFTASGTSTKTLNIQFLIPAIFELKANFRLSDGTTSFVSRQIDMTPLNALPTTPVLRWEQAQSYPYKVVLTNPQTGVTYNWQVSGGNIYYTANNYVEIILPSGSRPSNISVRCRSTNNHNGELSQWSDYLTISIPRGLVDGADSLRVGEPTEKLLHI